MPEGRKDAHKEECGMWSGKVVGLRRLYLCLNCVRWQRTGKRNEIRKIPLTRVSSLCGFIFTLKEIYFYAIFFGYFGFSMF